MWLKKKKYSWGGGGFSPCFLIWHQTQDSGRQELCQRKETGCGWKRLSREWRRADTVPSLLVEKRLWLVHLAEFHPLVPRTPTPSRKPSSPADPLPGAGHTQDTIPMPPNSPPTLPPLHLQVTGMFQGCPAVYSPRRVDFILHLFHLPPWFCAPFVFHSEFSLHPWLIWPSPNSKIYFFLSPPATCHWIASTSLSVSIFLL